MPARSTDATVVVLEAVATIVTWYQDAARDLPWRRTRDPYRILVSEIMLQQTRVDAVVGRYERFLVRFPSLEALGKASEDDVLAEWSGLGYYRRARNLHRLAEVVTREYGGQLPRDIGALRALPGLGDYTAAAVASIAFDLPHLSIDGNVARVLCRLLAIHDDPRRTAVKRQLRDATELALHRHSPAVLNQALMELGALICQAQSPRCDRCPCASVCRARERGLQAQIPPPRKRIVHDVVEAAAVVEVEGGYLLLRGQRPGVLESMWEFPTLDSRLLQGAAAHEPLETALSRYLAAAGVSARRLEPIGTIRHGITTRRIRCHVYRASGVELTGTAAEPAAAWFTADTVASLPLAASARKILALL